MSVDLLLKDSKSHEKITESDKIINLDELLNDFKDFDYKKLGLKSPYRCKIYSILFCPKCFVDHGKFSKKNSVHKILHHIDTVHQSDSNQYPKSNQIKRIIDLYSIKLQLEESRKTNTTKKQETQLNKIDSILCDLGMIVENK